MDKPTEATVDSGGGEQAAGSGIFSISTPDKNFEMGKRKVRIYATNATRQNDSEESDYETSAENEYVQKRDQYMRLRDEHVEAVVILKNETAGRGEPSDAMDAVLRNNGRLTFNLTPEELCDSRKSVSMGNFALDAGRGVGTRKSSLRKNSLHNNQSDLEKRLTMAKPKPVPDRAAIFGSPKKILMPVFGDDQECESFCDQKCQMNFDEILTVYDEFPTDFLPIRYKCGICKKLCHDPRVLDCLHTFCKRCLVELDANINIGSNQFWRRITESGDFGWTFSDDKIADEKLQDAAAAAPEPSRSTTVANQRDFIGESRFDQIRASFQSFKEKSCLKSPSKEKPKDNAITKLVYSDDRRVLVCPSCGALTELTLGGVDRLPPHFVMARKIEDIVSACGNPPPNVFCELCTNEVAATSSCSTCSLKLCNFCKEAHQRQRITSTHVVRTLAELLKKSRRHDPEARSIKCPMHPEHQLKLFCTTCHQVICKECAAFVHRDHKYTSASKACKVYTRFVKNAIEQTKPLEDYAMQSVGRLNDMSIRINSKCEAVERDVEAYIDEYIEALEAHRKSLLQQIGDVRDAKMEMIMAQKIDLEQRSQNARAAIDFAEEIINEGNEIENLIFVSILVKRFEQCLVSNRALDFKVTDTLEFLPEEATPGAKVQNRIALHGVITTQRVDPKKCTLENSAELACLKVHRKVDLLLVTKDYEGRPMNYGGMTVQTDLRYRDGEARIVPLGVFDNRNGTYRLSFVPERAGVMNLIISVDGRVIDGCPYVLRIRNLRPHFGVYHCCSFCSSNGSKYSTCACGSVMPGGYRGCGHGHEGHPGQRHWSCCANLQEHSDCAALAKKISKIV
ncbi:tripartite motif-containing protein 45 isoform X2 [Toxorhynchites rutilus septentrionalis]|uniref:tripartite motif-containing protein 45 isoform X2 n=1 Tax=Toxorhynchites rutilus septentrionalis TaxID=329112 RepID=UPI002478D65D|nr:tripartite motif-containing protein 45 isoform X2 [Toxorhynchites rutilus septentrionalis]